MSKILIIDGGKTFAHSKGELNHTLTEVAASQLRDLGHEVQVTVADSDYNVADEVQKYLDSDVVIYQMPGWWMGEPWTVKRYIDEVFTEGHGSLYASDGRELARVPEGSEGSQIEVGRLGLLAAESCLQGHVLEAGFSDQSPALAIELLATGFNGERHDALLASLAHDPDALPLRVDVLDVQPASLGHAQARSVHQLEEGPIAQSHGPRQRRRRG